MSGIRRQIQALHSPDHDLGLLGQLAHAVIADYLNGPPRAPEFHLGYNTLPDPPYPMPSRMWPGDDTLDGWLAQYAWTLAAFGAEPPPERADLARALRNLGF